MLTTVTEKIKLFRLTYTWDALDRVEDKVIYFTEWKEAHKWWDARTADARYSNIACEEVTALVTFNKE